MTRLIHDTVRSPHMSYISFILMEKPPANDLLNDPRPRPPRPEKDVLNSLQRWFRKQRHLRVRRGCSKLFEPVHP